MADLAVNLYVNFGIIKRWLWKQEYNFNNTYKLWNKDDKTGANDNDQL